MSTEQDKFKHSRRLLKDENTVNKQLKIARELGVPVKTPHRLAKQHALDCGNPKCLLCHGEKVFGKKTIKERRFDQDVDAISEKRSRGFHNDQEDLL
jgi:galactose-1-phosphate uridylyltransferase